MSATRATLKTEPLPSVAEHAAGQHGLNPIDGDLAVMTSQWWSSWKAEGGEARAEDTLQIQNLGARETTYKTSTLPSPHKPKLKSIYTPHAMGDLPPLRHRAMLLPEAVSEIKEYQPSCILGKGIFRPGKGISLVRAFPKQVTLGCTLVYYGAHSMTWNHESTSVCRKIRIKSHHPFGQKS